MHFNTMRSDYFFPSSSCLIEIHQINIRFLDWLFFKNDIRLYNWNKIKEKYYFLSSQHISGVNEKKDFFMKKFIVKFTSFTVKYSLLNFVQHIKNVN